MGDYLMASDVRERLLLRVPEAAEWLSVGRSTVYELVQRGELPTVHIGRSVRIPAAAVRAWVERRAAEAAPDLTPSA